ncbi:MAG: hypothetical protein LBR85_08265, partial [Oscillospiraceae bacterium]|nr:hypothetical protein [Oscillospiraceae bacterium]
MDGNDHNRSSYSVHCTEGKVSGAAKKSRHFSNGIIALIMTVSILCGMGSGVGSYFLADYLHRPSPEEAIPVFNTNPPTLTPNEGGPQLQSEETTPPPTTNAPTNAPEVNPATLAPQESVTPATLPPEESALPEQSANPGISPPTQSAPPRFDTPIDDVSEHVTLNMNVFYNGTTAMEYMQIDGSGRPTAEYVALNGKTYLPGDLKPIWAELQKRLNFTIRDVRPLDANHFSEGFKVAEAMDFDYNDILMGMSEQIVNGGLEMNAFIDFGMYLDLMPNFKAFLQNNDVARLSLTSGDGGIYCAPYFDGFDDIERMFIFRADWVRRLLDEDAAFDTDREVDTYYKPYIDAPYDFTVQAVTADGGGIQTVRKHASENIITTQNNLEVKNGETLTTALRGHIDAVYGDTYKNRSDLFIGQDAAYDADEMVALFRCVLANTSLLTGQSERPAVPFFPRWYQMGRAVDVYRLASIWGVRGLESRTGGYLYLDRNGEMK